MSPWVKSPPQLPKLSMYAIDLPSGAHATCVTSPVGTFATATVEPVRGSRKPMRAVGLFSCWETTSRVSSGLNDENHHCADGGLTAVGHTVGAGSGSRLAVRSNTAPMFSPPPSRP